MTTSRRLDTLEAVLQATQERTDTIHAGLAVDLLPPKAALHSRATRIERGHERDNVREVEDPAGLGEVRQRILQGERTYEQGDVCEVERPVAVDVSDRILSSKRGDERVDVAEVEDAEGRRDIGGVEALIDFLRTDSIFDGLLADLDPMFSRVAEQPFNRTKVCLKREIVTMGVRGIDPKRIVGIYVKPEDLNELIDRDDVLLLDARNSTSTRSTCSTPKAVVRRSNP